MSFFIPLAMAGGIPILSGDAVEPPPTDRETLGVVGWLWLLTQPLSSRLFFCLLFVRCVKFNFQPPLS